MTDPKHPSRQELRDSPVDPEAISRARWVRGFQAEREYKEKCEAIKLGKAGADFVFFGGEMVRYLLEKQGISEKDFNAALGFGHNYFRGNIFNYAWNNGIAAFPEPFRKRMTKLTRESLEKRGIDPVSFWCKRNFTLEDIDGIYIDMTKDIGEAKILYPKSQPLPNTQEALDKIPELARTLLIDPATKNWRRDTFLIDANGQFRPTRSMPSIRYLVEHPDHTPEAIITALTNPRKPDDAYFYDKGQFMREVLKQAKNERLISKVGHAQGYIPLKPENSSAWSR